MIQPFFSLSLSLQYCVVMVAILFVQIAAVVIAAVFQSKVSIGQANKKTISNRQTQSDMLRDKQ